MSDTPHVTAVPGSGEQSSGDQSLGALVNSAVADVRRLIAMEKELAVAEVVQIKNRVTPAVAAFAVAALAAVFFLLLGSVALAVGLGYWLTLGWGFVIVTGIWLAILLVAALFGRSALKKIQAPERTVRTVKDTADWARHPTTHPAVHADATPSP